MKQLYQYLFGGLFVLLTTGLLRAQDLPVDLATGAPVVSIPIHELTGTKVTLNYSGNGVKVDKNERVGNAGVGWSLSAGNILYREVKGLPDEYQGTTTTDTRVGWLRYNMVGEIESGHYGNDGDPNTCEDEYQYPGFERWRNTNADTEPDIFYFNCGGYSGKFVFAKNSTSSVEVIPYQNVHVDFNLDGNTFVITIGDGTKYKYTQTVRVTRQAVLKSGVSSVRYFSNEYEYYKNKVQFTQAWYLTEIEHANGRKTTFSYRTGSASQSYTPLKYAVYSLANTSNLYQEYEYELVETVDYGKELASIHDLKTKIEFTWGTNYIQNIKISKNSSSVILKEFDFQYFSVYSSPSVYLKTLSTKVGNCLRLPPFNFSYYGVDYNAKLSLLPMNSSSTNLDVNGVYTNELVKKDYWGYFNENTKSEIPTIFFYNDLNNENRYRIEPIPGLAYTRVVGMEGNSKHTDIATVAAGMLDKVTLPAGGYTAFVYEPNDYFDQSANNSTFKGEGVRVKKVVAHDGQSHTSNIVKELIYKQDDGHSSGRLIYPPSYVVPTVSTGGVIASIDNKAPEGGIIYKKVTVVSPGNGKVSYEFNVEGVYSSTVNSTMVYYSRPDIGDGCIALGNISNGTNVYPYPPNGDDSYKRGQVTRIQYFDQQNLSSPIKEEKYTYTTLIHGDRNGDGAINEQDVLKISGVKYDKVENVYVYGKYDIRARESKALLRYEIWEASQNNLSSKLTTSVDYFYEGSGKDRLLSRTRTTDSMGEVRESFTRYLGDMAQIISPQNTNDRALQIMQSRYMRSTPIERYEKLGSKVISATLSLFQQLGSSSYVGPHATYRLKRDVANYVPADVVPTSTGGTTFSYNVNNYILKSSLSYDSYYNLNIETLEDDRNNIKAIHASLYTGLPLAEIVNASADEVVYESFESNEFTFHELRNTQSSSLYGTAPGWTGERAYDLAANTVIYNEKVKYAGQSQYKLLCRITNSEASKIKVKLVANGTTATTIEKEVAYGANISGNWELVEVDITGVTFGSDVKDFQLQVSCSTSVRIDDILFFPASAVVNTYTYKSGAGRTSAIDSRGLTTFYKYDDFGRLTHVLDDKKNIRERRSYRFSDDPKPIVNANFKTPDQKIVKNVSVTFSSNEECLTGLTYEWKVYEGTADGQAPLYTTTTTDLSYSFPTDGKYIVSLKVSHVDYGSHEVAQEITVLPEALNAIVRIISGNQIQCETIESVQFEAVVNGGDSNYEIKYQWQTMYPESITWMNEGDGTSTFWATPELDTNGDGSGLESADGTQNGYVRVRCVVSRGNEIVETMEEKVTYTSPCN
jgi:hypothetical protein